VLDLVVAFPEDLGYESYEVDLFGPRSGPPREVRRDDAGWKMAERRSRRPWNPAASGNAARGEAGLSTAQDRRPDVRRHRRPWQGPTVQFDFNLPQRLGIQYVASDGSQTPAVMVHRAIYGSLERFMGGLVEHYAGAFPLWLAPSGAMVMPNHRPDARIRPQGAGRAAGRRAAVQIDERNEKNRRQDPRGADQEGPLHAGGGRREETANTSAVRSARWRPGSHGPGPIRDRLVR